MFMVLLYQYVIMTKSGYKNSDYLKILLGKTIIALYKTIFITTIQTCLTAIKIIR